MAETVDTSRKRWLKAQSAEVEDKISEYKKKYEKKCSVKQSIIDQY